jgi:2-methoxy-6-polyprenyl-1,4-benzoquinol methylase
LRRGSYDVMNDLMSGTLHRFWKDEFARMMGPLVTPGTSMLAPGTGACCGQRPEPSARVSGQLQAPLLRCCLGGAGDQQTIVLDVAGGTGDIAFRIVDKLRNSLVAPKLRPHVIVCDINPAMLNVGRQRARELGYAGAWAPALLFAY